ncbi:hypothetical protein HYX14_02950 [Candidatus Woesearchaeota archaeon]|nr:hypothetical protein [Candidatus Woesearchaeota archaeon]
MGGKLVIRDRKHLKYSSAGEEIFDEKTSEAIDEAAKKKGFWGLGAPATITPVGSSIAVVINKRIADFMGLKKGKEVFVHPKDKHKITMEV